MKKFKKWLNTKGGLYTLIATMLLVVVALFCVMIGYVYSDLAGNWNRLGEMFTNPFATTIYVVGALILLALLFISILFKRNEEI